MGQATIIGTRNQLLNGRLLPAEGLNSGLALIWCIADRQVTSRAAWPISPSAGRSRRPGAEPEDTAASSVDGLAAGRRELGAKQTRSDHLHQRQLT